MSQEATAEPKHKKPRTHKKTDSLSKDYMNNERRLLMKARRLVQARYGKDVDMQKTKAEYKALLASAKLEVMALDKHTDYRTVTRKTEEANTLEAGQQGLMAQPKGHATRKLFTASVKESVIEVFNNLGGVMGYTRWAERNPDKFYDHWAKLLPIEMKTTLEVNTNISAILQQARMRVANLKEAKGERVGDTDDGYSSSIISDMVADAEGVVSEQ